MFRAVVPIFIMNSLNYEHILGLLGCSFLLSQNCLQFSFWLQRLFLPQVLLKILPTPIFSWFFSFLLPPPCFWGHADLSNPWRRLKTYFKFAAVIWSLVQKNHQRLYMACQEYLFICLPYIHIERCIIFILNLGCVGQVQYFSAQVSLNLEPAWISIACLADCVF